MEVSNHWAWSQGVGLLVRFLSHRRNKEPGSCTWNNFSSLKDGKNAKKGEAIKNLSISFTGKGE